jgi:beta-N-acetylhexosaminidase
VVGVVAVACAALVVMSRSALPGAPRHSGTSIRRGQTRPSLRNAASLRPREIAAVELLLKKMTLREKVGQLFMTYAYGASANDPDPPIVKANLRLSGVTTAARLVAKYHLGGIILVGRGTLDQAGTRPRNLENPAQIALLCNGLQKAALSQRRAVPLLIATDQEQGMITRIGLPATQMPGNMALGADGSVSDTYAAAQITGEELRAMGINMDLAPVADVNVDPRNPVIGVRSFGSDASRVAKLTAAAVRGYQSAGVAASAKHFPGHGDTDVDSHYALPVVRHDLREVDHIDLPPFRAAIAAGVAAIMVGHLDVPALDRSRVPASLSHTIITGWLRDRLGFRGVVISDSLAMGGVRTGFSDAQIPVRALRAGVDVLLMPPDMATAFRSVMRAVKSGRISSRSVDQAVRRILILKTSLGLLKHPYVRVRDVSAAVGTPEHRRVARIITQRTITVVKLQQGILPLEAHESVLVTGCGDGVTGTVARCLRRLGVDARTYFASMSGSSSAAAADLSKTTRLTVVCTLDAARDLGQQALVHGIVRAGRPVIVVAVGGPYDVAALPQVGTYIAAYNSGKGSLAAACAVLTGRAKASGTLPVRISRSGRLLYPLGFGLSLPKSE